MIIERQKYKTLPPAMWQPEEDLSDPPAGYGFTPDSTPEKDIYFFHSDHLGSTSYLTDTAGNVTQFVWYSPYGESIIDEHTTSYENPFKFSGKELDDVTGLYDHGARSRDPRTTLWLGVDALWEIYTEYGPYVYCAGNPVKMVDSDGRAWKATKDENGSPTGYEWVEPENSYDSDGNLKEGLYEQAIFFSRGGENGDYNCRSNYNMGTSTATVYKSDGSIEEFRACTYPANTDKYPTVPEGQYQAYVGKHQGKYTALKMEDVGSSAKSNRSVIDLGCQNPSKKYDTNKAVGINIHRAGVNNLTGFTRKGTGVSEGCLLIDSNQWSDFISLFNTSDQKNNIVSISVSRTLCSPTNTQWKPSSLNSFQSQFVIPTCVRDATRVNNNLIK